VNRLPIANCQLPIWELPAGRSFSRRGHNCGEVVGFLQQCGQLSSRHNSRFCKQLKPQSRFIRFFFDSSDFGDEFSFATSATTRPLICGHRRTATNYLFCDNASRIVGFGNGPRQLDDSESKIFRALFQFDRVHAPKLPNRLPIGDCRLAIDSAVPIQGRPLQNCRLHEIRKSTIGSRQSSILL
jgi:hypothetical protein